MLAGAAGVLLMLLQGFLFRHPNITPEGWPTQPGMGYGALAAGTGFLMMFCQGLAARGFCRGDAFVVGAIGLVVATIAVFVFFPIFVMLASAFEGGSFLASFFDRSIWGIDCLYSSVRCGVAWNTVILAILVGAGSTLLGLAFALISARTAFRFKACCG
jgi:iron(III) transport system permease protein